MILKKIRLFLWCILPDEMRNYGKKTVFLCFGGLFFKKNAVKVFFRGLND